MLHRAERHRIDPATLDDPYRRRATGAGQRIEIRLRELRLVAPQPDAIRQQAFDRRAKDDLAPRPLPTLRFWYAQRELDDAAVVQWMTLFHARARRGAVLGF